MYRWRLVEVGRVVLFSSPSPYENQYVHVFWIVFRSTNKQTELQLSSRSLMPAEYVHRIDTQSPTFGWISLGYNTYWWQVLVEGPSSQKGKGVPRQSIPLAHVSLTPIVLKIPRAIGSGSLVSKWKEAGIEKQWKESAFAQGRERSAKRRALTDFERFKVMRLKKQVSPLSFIHSWCCLLRLGYAF